MVRLCSRSQAVRTLRRLGMPLRCRDLCICTPDNRLTSLVRSQMGRTCDTRQPSSGLRAHCSSLSPRHQLSFRESPRQTHPRRSIPCCSAHSSIEQARSLRLVNISVFLRCGLLDPTTLHASTQSFSAADNTLILNGGKGNELELVISMNRKSLMPERKIVPVGEK